MNPVEHTIASEAKGAYCIRRETRVGLGVWAVICATLIVGCQRPLVDQPLTATLSGNAPEVQLEFWHQLADRPITSNDDAFHGLLLYLDGEDPAEDYDGRVAALKQRGILPAGFDEPANQAVSRGTLAVAITKSLGVRGGLMMTLAPDCSRYAVRELVYLGVYPQSSPNQTFSGSEFLGIVGRMEDWQRGNPDPAPPREAPPPDGAPADAPDVG